ncbi:SLC13 family permease [Corynebacterium sp. 335C]
MPLRLLVPAAALAAAALAIAEPSALGPLAVRLSGILVFLAAVSATVNLAAAAGAFTALADGATRLLGGRAVPTWLAVVALAAVSTAFLSLDTAAVMVTPLAVAMARRAGLPVMATGLAVAWIANAGSLFLPVSNLTNLLAGSLGVLPTTGAHLRVLWPPATAALLAVVAYAAAVAWCARSRDDAPRSGTGPGPGGAAAGPAPRRGLAGPSLAVLAVLVPVLASPVPYWASTTVAALVLVALFAVRSPEDLSPSLVPWGAVALTVGLCCLAELVHAAGGAGLVRGLLGPAAASGEPWGAAAVAAAGAVAANLVNNLPAYLLLEPVAGAAGAQAASALGALLVGVNAGPMIAPWASLATILWADQMRRSGETVRWGTWARHGLVVAPLAVLPAALLLGA